jgi:hypothetical protein
VKAEDIIQAISTMTPEEIMNLTERLARVFAEKAESIFDQDPEKNAPLAQPYADISDAMSDASMAFTEPEGTLPVDEAPVSANTTPRTPKLAEVTGTAKKSWGGW